MNPAFNADMLVLARESREYTQPQVSELAKVPQSVISKLEGGLAAPTQEQIENLSRVLRYPVELFFQPDRVYGFNSAVFYHRKRSDVPARTLRKLHAVLNFKRMHISRLLRAAELDTEAKLVRLPPGENGTPEEIAQQVRAMLSLPPGPIRNLSAAVEDAGGILVRFSFGTSKADAISEWLPCHPPIFLMNYNEAVTGDRYRWNLAHELGHLIMHQYPSPTMEEEANRFAAELLLPAAEIKSQLRSVRLDKLSVLKSYWKVSMGALLERARQLRTINQNQYKYMRMNFSRLGYNKREPTETDFPVESPSLLQELIDIHMTKLQYSSGDLARLLNVNEEECKDAYLPSASLRLVSAKTMQRFA